MAQNEDEAMSEDRHNKTQQAAVPVQRIVMWVGLGDKGSFIFWPSLSYSKIEAKRKIYDWLYAPLGDEYEPTEWEFKKVEIKIPI